MFDFLFYKNDVKYVLKLSSEHFIKSTREQRHKKKKYPATG